MNCVNCGHYLHHPGASCPHCNRVIELPPLSVAEIERLAKAGVTMSFQEVSGRVISDPPRKDRDEHPNTLNEALWMRWRMAHSHRDRDFGLAQMAPYTTACTAYGDKVYVFVAPTSEPPFIIEDAAAIFPSDALMGSLALFEKVKS